MSVASDYAGVVISVMKQASSVRNNQGLVYSLISLPLFRRTQHTPRKHFGSRGRVQGIIEFLPLSGQ